MIIFAHKEAPMQFFVGLLLFAFSLAVFNASASQTPCVVTQLDSNMFATGQVVDVNSLVVEGVGCPFIGFRDDGWFETLAVTLARVGDQGETLETRGFNADVALGQQRQRIARFEGLSDGRYVLTVANVDSKDPQATNPRFLEAIYFVVGSVPTDTFGQISRQFVSLPYVRPSREVKGNYLFFSGEIGKGVSTEGYLYQVTPDRTVIVPAVFEVLPVMSGPLSALRVKIPSRVFDFNRQIFASVTVDGGGQTTQGLVFDPTSPSANVAPSYK